MELEAFDATPAVVKWFNSVQRSRRPNICLQNVVMGITGFRLTKFVVLIK